jgi:hypothetical protein
MLHVIKNRIGGAMVSVLASSESAMYSIVALNMHSPQLGKVGKYKRGKLCIIGLFVCLMVFSAIFNNISAMSLVETL